MVVHAHADDPLGPFLPDDILVEPLENLARSTWKAVWNGRYRRLIVCDDLVAVVHALVADEYL
jgi:hypothetical protein